MLDEKANQFDLIFKALSDSRRRKIVDMLTNIPLTTGYICQSFPELGRATVMQHIGVLEAAGLVTIKRVGKHRWNYLNKKPIEMVHSLWISKLLINHS